MSEDLLLKFISEIEQEEGVGEARKKAKEAKRDARRGMGAQRKEIAKIELKAAARGALQLPSEQAYLQITPIELNEAKGICLIDEARSRQSIDHTERNIKYMKYTEKLAMDKDQVKMMMIHHNRSLPKTKNLRSDREKVTCLREPKRDSKGKIMKKKKSGSVFSEADFARLNKKPKGAVQDADGVFL